MRKVPFCKEILNKQKHFIHSEFARKFSQSNKWRAPKVSFIATRQEALRQHKVQKLIGNNPITSSFETSQEIWDSVTNGDNQLNSASIHNAIRKCSDLNDIEMCWRLLEYAKSHFLVDSNVYCAMIMILNHSKMYTNQHKVMQIYYELMNEMKTFNIEPNHVLITAIFSFLTKYQQWEEADNIWNKLKESQNRSLMHNTQVWNAYIDINIKQCLIETHKETNDSISHITHIIKLLDSMCNEYDIKPNDITFGSIISAVAKMLKSKLKSEHFNDKEEYINIGERLFKECAEKCGHEPFDNVYATMIDLYGNAGNIEKCMEFLEIVINNQIQKKSIPSGYKQLKGMKLLEFIETGFVAQNEWNERTLRSCFGSTLKAIVNNKDISYVNGWKLINHIIHDLLENKCGLQKDVVIYGMLFHIHGAFGKENIDTKKLKKLYKEMLKNGIKPNSLSLNNFAICALQKYENDKKKSDKFAKWVVREFIKYKIPIPRVLQVKLNKLMVYHDETIRNMVRHAQTI